MKASWQQAKESRQRVMTEKGLEPAANRRF